MIDSESACLRGRATPSWAAHADQADSPRTIGEDAGTTPTGDGEAVSGRWPATVWRIIRRRGGLESVIQHERRTRLRHESLEPLPGLGAAPPVGGEGLDALLGERVG